MYDFLIVGAGLYGCVFAERAKAANKKVLVLEQRNHIGGNCYTEERSGINVHIYGPHIFHTNDISIWKYINRFADFNNYINRVKVNYKNKIYSFPINLLTLHQLWGVNTPQEAKDKLTSKISKITDPKNMEEWCLANVGEEIYNIFFKGYTKKHWKCSPTDLPASTIRRLPIRFNYDDNYYNDQYQGVPIGGYTQIFEKMLDGIEVKLNTSIEKDWYKYAKTLVYSGKPDQLLDYKYGELSYLTLDFKHQLLTGDYQGNAVVNYTDEDIPFTRCIEHKHFEFNNRQNTIITHEYPINWHKQATPYYPMPNQMELYQLYKNDILQNGNIILGGRLGLHKYLDMHQVIANALKTAKKTFNQ